MELIVDGPADLIAMYHSVAAKKDAKFLGEFDWADTGVHMPVFYQKEKHPRGSHYFGLYHTSWMPDKYIFKDKDDEGHWMICDAGKIEDKEWHGFVFPEGIFYSRSRHDFRTRNGHSIDGGACYAKASFPPETETPQPYVTFRILNGEVNARELSLTSQ